VHHELGVLAFQEANYSDAADRFLHVLKLHRQPPKKKMQNHNKNNQSKSKNHMHLSMNHGDDDNDDDDDEDEVEVDNPSIYLSGSGSRGDMGGDGSGIVSGVNLGRLLPVACATTVYNLGQCYRKMKQWQLAARCFEVREGEVKKRK
jgi:hypothetical protein